MFWPSLDFDGRPSRSLLSTPTVEHVPVMLKEVLDLLGCGPRKNFFDLTVGGGGHAEAILRATAPDGMLVGADRDTAALGRAGARLHAFGKRVKLLYGSLKRVRDTVQSSALSRVDGALIDCGLSSHQLEDPQRGFSFQRSGPLDMRMDLSSRLTARDWLARATAKELADAIFRYGEERFARRIARAIVAARKQKKIQTTEELSNVVRAAVPAAARGKGIDPATRTFQAVRIVVNDELAELETGISDLLELLPVGARLVVISFHSLEDRIVKNLFRGAAKEGRGKILTAKPLRPTENEVARNPRARSARLRALEIAGGTA